MESQKKLEAGALEEERERLNKLAKNLMEGIEVARHEQDWDRIDKLEGQLEMCKRKAKMVLFKLGKWTPGEDEEVEYAPGRFMLARHYYMLMVE